MKVLLSSALCLVCWGGLSADFHAASGYLRTDATNTTWALDSGSVIESGFEHWDYDGHGNLLRETSTVYQGPITFRFQTRYILNVHGDPVESFGEYATSDPDYSSVSRSSTLYYYTNAGRLAGLSFQSDADGDGIWDTFGTTQNYYNPRGLLLRSVSNGRDWSDNSFRTIQESQWNPRGELVSYSEELVSMNPVQTNFSRLHFTVTTTRDMITEDGEIDSDWGDEGHSVWLEHSVERLSRGLPISVHDESFTIDGELQTRISTTFTWDEHGNLLRDWSKAEYFDGSLPSQISVNDYTYVKRPYANNQSTAVQDQQQMAPRILLTPSLRERMLRELPSPQSKLPNAQSWD